MTTLGQYTPDEIDAVRRACDIEAMESAMGRKLTDKEMLFFVDTVCGAWAVLGARMRKLGRTIGEIPTREPLFARVKAWLRSER